MPKRKKKSDQGIGGTWLPVHAAHAAELQRSAEAELQARRGAPTAAGSRLAGSGASVSGSLVIECDDALVDAGLSAADEIAHLTRNRSSFANFEPQRFVHMVNGRPVVVLP